MANFDRVTDRLAAAGLNLRQADVDDIEAEMAALPVDEHDQIAPAVYEAIAQIVNDPAYDGDVAPIS